MVCPIIVWESVVRKERRGVSHKGGAIGKQPVKHSLMWRLLGVGVLVLLAGCVQPEPLPTADPTAIVPLVMTPPPTPPVTLAAVSPTPSPAAVPLPTAVPLRIGATAAVPPELVAAAQQVAAQSQARFAWIEQGATLAQADILLAAGEGKPLAQWVYAVAAPFATVADEVTMAELLATWQTGGNLGWSFYVDAPTAAAITTLWGQPSTAVQVVPASELIALLWANRPSWTIIPFHKLQPELKALRLDGVSLLQRDFAGMATYPLVVDIGVTGKETAVAEFLSLWQAPATNRDPGKLTRVAMSGVTALTRATAFQMELNGVYYPGTAVGEVLQTADIAHVSNEVSFASDCPYPDPLGDTTFCSRDRYFPLLQEIGVDVVELTGNHVNDWGRESLLHSIDLYEEAGMVYFGGGRNLADASKPALFSHNGNAIAFVGCNWVGPAYAWATAETAGARPCGDDFYVQIGELQADGYLVIATLQYQEYYHYAPTAQQQTDFQAGVAAGATAVSGSQGHHAQGFDVYDGRFIHYGLGNLFFDQMDQLGTRQTFVDTYVIYEGRLLSVELWTGLIENWSRPRLMTAEERAAALTAVFETSGW